MQNETSILPIIEVTTRYVLSNEPQLVSPKGYHSGQPFYYQTMFFEQVDILPTAQQVRETYGTDVQVYAHDIHKFIGRA